VRATLENAGAIIVGCVDSQTAAMALVSRRRPPRCSTQLEPPRQAAP
jgi:hypothetical protein